MRHLDALVAASSEEIALLVCHDSDAGTLEAATITLQSLLSGKRFERRTAGESDGQGWVAIQ
jgi:hypothetical protein